MKYPHITFVGVRTTALVLLQILLTLPFIKLSPKSKFNYYFNE